MPAVLEGIGRHPWRLTALLVALAAVIRAEAISEADVYWQARAGEDVLRGAPIIGLDRIGQAPHARWVPNSWGWNVVLGAAWRWGGFPLLGVTVAASVLVVYLVLLRQCRNRGALGWATAVTIVATTPVLLIFLSGRPQQLSYLGLLAVLALVARALTGSTAARVWALVGIAAVQVVTVNMHLAAVFSCALVASGLAAYLVHARLGAGSSEPGSSSRGKPIFRLAGKCALIGAVMVGASLISPVGVGIFRQSRTVGSQSGGLITEWASLWQLRSSPLLFFAGLVCLLAAGTAVRQATRHGRWLVAGALIAAGAAGLFAYRFLGLALILAVPEIAVWASGRRFVIWAQSRRRLLAVGSALLAIPLAVAATLSLPRLGQPQVSFAQASSVDALPPRCRVFNDYESGGLIALLRPDVPTWVDGRNDYWGKSRLERYDELRQAQQSAVQGLVDAGTDCALLSDRGDMVPLREALLRRGWVVRTRDRRSAIWTLAAPTFHGSAR